MDWYCCGLAEAEETDSSTLRRPRMTRSQFHLMIEADESSLQLREGLGNAGFTSPWKQGGEVREDVGRWTIKRSTLDSLHTSSASGSVMSFASLGAMWKPCSSDPFLTIRIRGAATFLLCLLLTDRVLLASAFYQDPRMNSGQFTVDQTHSGPMDRRMRPTLVYDDTSKRVDESSSSNINWMTDENYIVHDTNSQQIDEQTIEHSEPYNPINSYSPFNSASSSDTRKSGTRPIMASRPSIISEEQTVSGLNSGFVATSQSLNNGLATHRLRNHATITNEKVDKATRRQNRKNRRKHRKNRENRTKTLQAEWKAQIPIHLLDDPEEFYQTSNVEAVKASSADIPDTSFFEQMIADVSQSRDASASARYREHFDFFDLNSDGSIGFHEWEVVHNLLGVENSPPTSYANRQQFRSPSPSDRLTLNSN